MASNSDVPSVDYDLLANMLASSPQDVKYNLIVEAPFVNKLNMAFLFLGFICLYIVDEKKAQVQLKAASGTEEYRLAVEQYNFNPSDYHLDFDIDKDNTIVKAITKNEPQDTADWVTLSRKNTSVKAVRLNQANSGIAYTAIYPFTSSVRGALMYNFYQYPERIDGQQRAFMKQYTDLISTYVASITSY